MRTKPHNKSKSTQMKEHNTLDKGDTDSNNNPKKSARMKGHNTKFSIKSRLGGFMPCPILRCTHKVKIHNKEHADMAICEFSCLDPCINYFEYRKETFGGK